jgi:hypothetical protein
VKIPVRDFLVSANIPTGLDCAGLCWTGPLALMGIMCSGLRVEATPLNRAKAPPLARSLNVEISVKIPTGLDYAGLFSVQPLALSGETRC